MIRVCERSAESLVSGRGQHTVTALSVAPDQRCVVAATHSRQLFVNEIPSLEPAKVGGGRWKDLLKCNLILHEGALPSWLRTSQLTFIIIIFSQPSIDPTSPLAPVQLSSLLFRPLHTSHHEGAVVDAATCAWKPLVATAAKDR